MSSGRICDIQLRSGVVAAFGDMYGKTMSSSRNGPCSAGQYTSKAAISPTAMPAA